MRVLLAVCLGLVCGAVHAGESAYTVRATDLKAKPFIDAATVAQLPENRKVEMLQRQASWIKVKAEGATGWVRMLSLRMDDPAAAGESSNSGIGSLFRAAATGNSGSTTTTGVKGVTEENLKNAQPNPEALKKVQSFTATKADAQRFAKAGKLTPQKLDYLASDDDKK